MTIIATPPSGLPALNRRALLFSAAPAALCAGIPALAENSANLRSSSTPVAALYERWKATYALASNPDHTDDSISLVLRACDAIGVEMAATAPQTPEDEAMKVCENGAGTMFKVPEQNLETRDFPAASAEEEALRERFYAFRQERARLVLEGAA